ncbi:protein BCP1, putative [Entamoeba dispar SAW760]|uniref:Protein BCP1, putative n=1 Tax=Entamoeba dispar (strain ATCC PRA-260 / SAW760) TaxID=370354 RepID=B0EC50_ENTDS|nr:protein BCP1, putative [Entamoeba dispar SAW760]EDR27898.1 protein BCP1, putative [Entamoeba dispar SAW760]|eukprot:EDR27898.1 protein BCP1, putative [Entamoeba dispar SAW760]
MKRRARNAMEEEELEENTFVPVETDEGDDAMEEINVDIFLENQSENDYLEIKNFLLHSPLKYTGINLRTLTDILIKTEIGSVIKNSDNDTYGLAIPVDFESLKVDGIYDDFCKYTINAFQQYNQEKLDFVQKVLSGEAGRRMLIVNERMVNCPSDLNSLLHSTIYEEIGIYDTEHHITQPVNYYVIAASCVKGLDEDDENNDDEEQTVIRRKKKIHVSDDLEYLLMENQIYSKFAEAGVVVSVSSKDRWTLPGKVKDFISIMIINSKQISNILKEITDAFGTSKFIEEK